MNRERIKRITIISIVSTITIIIGSYIWWNFYKINAGFVGVKVYLLGSNKGVDNEVVGPGRYFLGINEELYLFPTFQQTIAWKGDDAFTFQTSEGMMSTADMSLSFTLEKDKISTLFQTYRRGIDEVSDVYMKNIIRDSVNQIASEFTVEEICGEEKQKFQDKILKDVRNKMAPIGIKVDYIAFIGGIRPPESVVRAIDAKVEATQRAQQRENELREAEAQAKKLEAIAAGEANARIQEARGRAESIRIEAEAKAEANKKIAESIKRDLIDYNATEKWDGKLPQVTSGNNMLPIINIQRNNN